MLCDSIQSSICPSVMNLQLINPFAQNNFPENVDLKLDANAQCVAFNAGTSQFAGSYLAIGRNDGKITILDHETRNYLCYLEGHVKTVKSLQLVENEISKTAETELKYGDAAGPAIRDTWCQQA